MIGLSAAEARADKPIIQTRSLPIRRRWRVTASSISTPARITPLEIHARDHRVGNRVRAARAD